MSKLSRNSALEESPRFQEPASRRDFLGLAAIWSAVAAFGAALIGSLRLPMPSVFPESNSRVKIGHPERYPKGSVTHLPELRLWVFHDAKGLYSISSICTHLGCIAGRSADGIFRCPCHGSIFAPDGKVLQGPAPTPLHWIAMGLSPDGQLLVDTAINVPLGTRLPV